MANNETFYRAARAALDDESTISELVIVLDAAVESYLEYADESGELGECEEEIRCGVVHAERFLESLRDWSGYSTKAVNQDAE